MCLQVEACWAYFARMKKQSSAAVLRLLRVQAALETRFSSVLGSVHGLALKDLLILMNLERAALGRLRRVDLAAAVAVSQSTVTRMTAPLEKIGLVARDTDPRDARVAYVVLTDAGRKIVGDARVTLARLADEVFVDRWTDADIARLADLLGRLSSALPGNLR